MPSGWRLPDDPAGWQARIRGLAEALRVFAPVARARASEASRQARQARTAAQKAAADLARAAHLEVDAALAEVLRTTARDVVRRAEGSAGTPDAVRIGTFRVPRGPTVPVVVPLLSRTGWWLEGPPAESTPLLLGVLLRLIASVPPGRLQIDMYDPALTGAFGPLAPFRDRAPDFMPATMREPPDLAACLAELAIQVHSRGARPEFDIYRVVVLQNYPAGLDEDNHRQLLRLIDSAPGRGVSFLVQYDELAEPGRGVDTDDLLDRLWSLTYQSGRWTIAGLDGVEVIPDPAPAPELCARICAEVGEAAARAGLPVVPLGSFLPAPEKWWSPVDRCLVTEIGLGESGPAVLELSTSDPARPNVLIGGSVGTGKSNLLLVLIHTLAVRYSPDDLRMYLLDFKQGIEFAGLTNLPHVEVLGIYSDREFGLAVLRDAAHQLELRSAEFKRLGCTDIAKPPAGMRPPPRLLLVLDEFQVLLTEDDEIALEATAKLEHLVRQGRAYGIHVVLATQSLDGIPRLSAKQDAILGQIHHRVVLKTTPSDSQSMLRTHNLAAAGLRFRGQAVLNADLGAPDANRMVQIAYGEQSYLEDIRRALNLRRPAHPRIFEQNAPAELDLTTPPRAGDDGSMVGWAGIPVRVSDQPQLVQVRPEPGAGLLVLGEDEEMALGSLTGMAAPLALAGAPHGDSFVLLDFVVAKFAQARDNLVALLGGIGVAVEVVGRDGFADRLRRLVAGLPGRSHLSPRVHVLGLGLHRAARMPVDTLRDLVSGGPVANVFVYGWWNRLGVCTAHLGWDRCGVTQYLFLRHPVDGIREVCGHGITWESRQYRGLFWDGLGNEPVSLVTFAPLKPPRGRNAGADER